MNHEPDEGRQGQFCTCKQLAAETGLSSEYIRQQCASGELIAIALGSKTKRHWRIRRVEWDAFLSRMERREKQRPDKPKRVLVPNLIGI